MKEALNDGRSPPLEKAQGSVSSPIEDTYPSTHSLTVLESELLYRKEPKLDGKTSSQEEIKAHKEDQWLRAEEKVFRDVGALIGQANAKKGINNTEEKLREVYEIGSELENNPDKIQKKLSDDKIIE